MSNKQAKRPYDRLYYQKHRQKISERRRIRYQTDTAFRARLMDRARATSRAKWRAIVEERRKLGLPRPGRGFNRPRLLVPSGGGNGVLVYGTGQFALKLGYTENTVRQLEQLGILPPPTIRDDSKLRRRWYSAEHIERVYEAVQQFRRSCVGLRRSALRDIIRATWPKEIGAAPVPVNGNGHQGEGSP